MDENTLGTHSKNMTKNEDIRYRIEMTCSCKDSDQIPKVTGAGCITPINAIEAYQLMHNGLRVKARGYHDAWMEEIIKRLKGHHEPQEELVFHEALKRLKPEATMIELGSFWSYYSLWFLKEAPAQRRAICLEPDENHLAVGKFNAILNDLHPQFLLGFAGNSNGKLVNFEAENGETLQRRGYRIDEIMNEGGIEYLDILHCDTQGAELEVLLNCKDLIKANKIRFIIISTHSYEITGDPLMHQKCLELLEQYGASIIAEHDVHESFSGDGLIAASFADIDKHFTVKISHNRQNNSLFPSPAFHLAKILQKPDAKHTQDTPNASLTEIHSSSQQANTNPDMFYAQNFEDAYLWRCFGKREHGFFIDVGAEQPVIDSVTYKLYLNGWRGINIEPQPEYFKQLENMRPEDINLNLAIGLAEDTSLDFYATTDAIGLAGFGESARNELIKQGYNPVKIKVEVNSLDNVCSDQNVREIDFLKIDVEGHELQVLRSFSFATIRPKLVIIEATKPNTNNLREDNQAIGTFMEEKKYSKIFFDGLNEWWAEQNSRDLQKHFQLPVNCLDGISPSSIEGHRLLAVDALEKLQITRLECNSLVGEAQKLQEEAQQAQAKAEQAQAQAQQAQAKAEQAQAHAQQAQAKAQQAQAQAELQLDLTLKSTTWRITEPIRKATDWLKYKFNK
jgi:FkbM family methyltransferase